MPGTPWNAISHLPEEALNCSCVGVNETAGASRAHSPPDSAACGHRKPAGQLELHSLSSTDFRSFIALHIFYLLPELSKNKFKLRYCKGMQGNGGCPVGNIILKSKKPALILLSC